MPQATSIDTKNIRIAFVTDDGASISPHFGRARYYKVVTISNGTVVSQEQREKMGHHSFNQPGDEHSGHGAMPDHGDRGKHEAMVKPISDCRILVARGMGAGAHDHLSAAGITPVITNCRTIAEALEQIAHGSLDNHPERLH